MKRKKTNLRLAAVIAAAGLMLAACTTGDRAGAGESAAAESTAEAQQEAEKPAASETGAGGEADQEKTDMSGQVASGQETISQADVLTEDMEPVYGKDLKDGVYEIQVDSSSSMFKIAGCTLTVEQGAMRALLSMSGKGYLKLFMGTGQEAVQAAEADYIPFVKAADGTHTFEIPVEALDMGILCSAYSKNKEKWYDRVLVFRADSLPADAFTEGTLVTVESLGLTDGTYLVEVSLTGGSGRAKVQSPARLRVEDGKAYATIAWGSSNYDYMKVDGEKYEPFADEENSTFEIPVAGFDRKLPVAADTTAMSAPHEISYTLEFDSSTIQQLDSGASANVGLGKPIGSMELSYARQFSVDYYDGGYAVITVKDGETYLVVPEDAGVPEDLPEKAVVIKRPLRHIYLAATSAMDLIGSLGSVDAVTLSGTDVSGWYIEEAKQAMEAGTMVYAGKYSAPDYEKILSEGCDLAVESTMIFHTPEVKERLEELGIPVFVERSSYESHPLGRMEWIKLYGVLLGKEEQSEAIFKKEMEKLKPVLGQKATGKTAAFFYITSRGAVNVRKPGDYVSKMIQLAGGTYVPRNLETEDNALSTMNMQMEAFYVEAKDADHLIYNSTIDGELYSMEELLAKSPLLKDFKAVKEGNVWCTGKNLFQETMGLGAMITDLHEILSQETPDEEGLTYLHRLK